MCVTARNSAKGGSSVSFVGSLHQRESFLLKLVQNGDSGWILTR